MGHKFIEPAMLNGDAVIPQAADNQFVTPETYAQIISSGDAFDSPQIAEQKKKSVHTEMVRSLLYSSQVVVNRAFLENNEGLYSNWLPGEENLANAEASAQLVREGVLVPFLYRQSVNDFLGAEAKRDFSTLAEGRAALAHLFDLAGDSIYTGFPDGHPNLSILSAKFQEFVCNLRWKDPDLINHMSSELLPAADLGDPEAFTAFSSAVKSLGRWACDYRDKSSFGREQVYAQWFVEDNTDPALGRFRTREAGGFQFALKKLVDLKYNSNMPDSIARYTFTPYGMPTRSALADQFATSDTDSGEVERLVSQSLSKQFARIFHANASNAMFLPFLGDLTMADVVEIRSLPEREPFIRIQAELLANPLGIPQGMEDYQDAFVIFQRALSAWYRRRYRAKEIERRFDSYATIGIKIGGRTLVYGLTQELDELAYDAASMAAWEVIRHPIKGMSVKMMLWAYDHAAERFDPDLSFSIESMRSARTYTRDEIHDLVRGFEKNARVPRTQEIYAEADGV